jgi:hypothetical protein
MKRSVTSRRLSTSRVRGESPRQATRLNRQRGGWPVFDGVEEQFFCDPNESFNRTTGCVAVRSTAAIRYNYVQTLFFQNAIY